MNYSADLEKRIIGNLLLDENLNHLEIGEQHFYYPEIQELFKSIVICKADKNPIENVYLQHENQMDLLSDCTSLGVVTTNYRHNCRNLKRLYAARELAVIGYELSGTGYKGVEKTIEEFKNRLNNLTDDLNSDEVRVINPEQVSFEDRSKVGFVPTGFETVDNCLNDLEPKRVTLITGPSFAGKTTFVRQVIANAINTNNKTLWIMGENETQDELRRLFEIVIGRKKDYYDIVRDNKRYIKIPKKPVLDALKKWYRGKLRILHKAEAKLKSHHEMFELLENELMSKRHNLIVVDNLMSVLSASSFEKNEAQADFMQRCCDLAKVYDTHIALVLHPRKGTNVKLCENDDISGSSDIPNKADNIIWVTKATEDEKLLGIDGWVHVKKNKKWGDTVSIKTYFDRETNSLSEITNGKTSMNKIDIEKFINKEVVYYNGEKQTFKNGEI